MYCLKLALRPKAKNYLGRSSCLSLGGEWSWDHQSPLKPLDSEMLREALGAI